MAYAEVRDASNPFNTSGISDEDRALINYLIDAKKATGIDVVVTCTTDHPSGPTRHLQNGTNGLGLAIDCRLRTRGNNIHKAVFDLFVPIEKTLYELIYSGAAYSIKAGKRVSRYAIASHWDHVHVAVNKGVFVRWPNSPPRPPPEVIMARVANSVGYAIMNNDDLVITTTDGAIYHFDSDGVADETDYAGAYNANPQLWNGSTPTAVRTCIGIYAVNRAGKAVPNGSPEAFGYCQVFDDSSRYRWVR